jgi:hypothetical protein
LAPAAGTTALSGQTSAATPTSLDSFSVVVPGPGVLYVQVSGQWWFDADATTTNSITSSFNMGLCDTPNSAGFCGGTWVDFDYQDADNVTSLNSTMGFTLTRTIAIAAAGTYKYYVNASTSSGFAVHLYPGTMGSAIYFPNSLTVTSPAAPPVSGPVQQR